MVLQLSSCRIEKDRKGTYVPYVPSQSRTLKFWSPSAVHLNPCDSFESTIIVPSATILTERSCDAARSSGLIQTCWGRYMTKYHLWHAERKNDSSIQFFYLLEDPKILPPRPILDCFFYRYLQFLRETCASKNIHLFVHFCFYVVCYLLAFKRNIELVSILASGHQPPPPKKGPGDWGPWIWKQKKRGWKGSS